MIKWPETLVQEVAARRCVLFLGAGVSASAKTADGVRPKTWQAFLEKARCLVPVKADQERIKRLINHGDLLLALEAIKRDADPHDYQKLLNDEFHRPQFQPGELHRTILRLDSRLVITVNFDKIYENCCLAHSNEAIKVVTYNSGSLFDEIRSEQRLLIKAHGSIDDVDKMIFSRSQYREAKFLHPNFYRLLEAIFLTHTALFIGCGLNDPDIMLVLEDVKRVSSSSKPHYALALRRPDDKYKVKNLDDIYNIRVLEYRPDHGALLASLQDLLERVDVIRATTMPAAAG
jgi:hypothetical protein